MSQENLPRATPKFSGEIKKVITDSTPEKLLAPKAPTDAPNILLIMLDDVGFGSFGNFGGPVRHQVSTKSLHRVCVTTSFIQPHFALRRELLC